METDRLREGLFNLRADLDAQRLLMDCMLISMTASAREALKHNYEALSERYMADMLASSSGASDESIHGMQQAFARVKLSLAHLPKS